ncbi:N-formylglutamate amidohydrolase, partial [Vibrio parahaemolyticus]|uniref:N-formylglutamate amidohydrolase n=1 Tax=Vibrio parahaemolyticus TaxID=670 RepID=UPI001A8F643F
EGIRIGQDGNRNFRAMKVWDRREFKDLDDSRELGTRSMRVAGGLGTVPRIVADGQEVYRERLPVEEAVRRIETLYKPYHRTLRGLIHRTARTFGRAFLIDCHSMPSSSLG